MKHEFLDHHSLGNSFFHRMHPGAKMVMVVLFIFCIVTFQPGQERYLLPYAGMLLCGLLLTRVPLSHSLLKGLKLLPFVLVLTILVPFFREGTMAGSVSLGGFTITWTQEGLDLFFNIMAKSTLAIFSVVFLNLTTPFHSLLKGIQSLGAPRIMTDTLVIAYRYLFVISGERERMLMARRARHVHPTPFLEWRSLSQLVAMLFIRSYNRGDRLYQAMCSRGYDGTILTLTEQPLLLKDIITVTLITVWAILFRIVIILM
ncbi:MAG: cobalt ECF transporter T component CbiQ [bacterium]|nr:cobalt ECF transporter T component CbiQ [bacterium]